MVQDSYSAQLSYTEMFTADELTVEFDGTTHRLANKGDGEYGGGSTLDSTNPIGIRYINGVNNMYIRTNLGMGDHHVVIKAESSSIETTECFKKAVKSVGGGVMMLNLVESDPLSIEGATWQEAYNALQNGTMVYLKRDGDILPCGYFDNIIIGFDTTIISAASQVINTISIVWSASGSISDQSRTYPSA